jgi:hypothetical protein
MLCPFDGPWRVGFTQKQGMAITMMWMGQYTYEQVASIFEADNNRVSSPTVDAMVSKAIDYVTANTPPRSPTPPELQILYDCGTPPQKGQDEVPTQSSQAAARAP